MALRAGVAEGTITPALGTRLSGYGGRHQPAAEVHDDLRCQALVLEADDERGSGRARVALLTCDLVGLPVPLALAWRTFLAERTGIPARGILMSCTHTHAAPVTGVLIDPVDGRAAVYLDQLKHCLAGALETAAAGVRPARLAVGTGRVRVQRNRRDRLGERPGGAPGPVDETVGVLRLDDASTATPLAVVVHYACHPVALRDNNLGFSADYVGWVRRTVRQATGAPCVFLQGACGDLVPDVQPPAEVGEQMAVAERIGGAVGNEAARATRAARVVDDVRLGAAALIFDACLALPPEKGETTVPFEVQCLRIGPVALVGIPVEPLCAVGLALRGAAPGSTADVWCAGYANGCYGYLPPAQEYPRGGYEVGSAHRYYGQPAAFAPDTAARVVAAAGEAVAALYAGSA